MKLTKSAIDALQPAETERWIWDSTLPGFGVRVQISGRKTYIIRYRTRDGQQRKLTIGRCCDMTPDRARELARSAFADAAAGADPTTERKELKTAPLIRDLAERYMRDHARPFKKASSAHHDDKNWKRHILPIMANKRVDAVTKAEITSLHASLASKPATANQVRALLSKAFNLAIDWGWRTGANPCVGVKRYKIRQRELILTPAQLAAMDAALTDLVSRGMLLRQFGDLFRLLALTGCRLNEIMSARRDWIDMERRLLLLPDSKVGQRRIPLPAHAIDIISAMPPHKWLIPGKIGGSHMTQPHTAWDRVVEHAGLPPETRIHDLRHTAGSIGHRSGLSQRQIAELLGHASLATTERYLHGFVEDRQSAVDLVANNIATGWAK